MASTKWPSVVNGIKDQNMPGAVRKANRRMGISFSLGFRMIRGKLYRWILRCEKCKAVVYQGDVMSAGDVRLDRIYEAGPGDDIIASFRDAADRHRC